MTYKVPGEGEIELDTIILDLNGTLSVNGRIPDGVIERVAKLKEMGFQIVLFTGDQRGTAAALTESLGMTFTKTSDTEEKRAAAKLLNHGKTVAIGNARIDKGTFGEAKIRIGCLQAEGIHSEILQYTDIIVPSILDAFGLLIDPDTFAATMRL